MKEGGLIFCVLHTKYSIAAIAAILYFAISCLHRADDGVITMWYDI